MRARPGSRSCPPGQVQGLFRVDAPPGLDAFVTGFARRVERAPPGAWRLFAEPRASIQLQRADPYYFSRWTDPPQRERTPDAAFWRPRFGKAMGWTAGRIDAYGFGLTPQAHGILQHRAGPFLAGSVADAAALAPELARTIRPDPGELLEAWALRVSPGLQSAFERMAAAAPPLPDLSSSAATLATEGGAAAREAARIAGLGVRQFRRVFPVQYGAAPKLYARALRIDRMLRQLHPAPWEADGFGAYPVPFFDQPHLIREFRAFTGLTPGAYRRQAVWAGAVMRSLPLDGAAPPPPIRPRESRQQS